MSRIDLTLLVGQLVNRPPDGTGEVSHKAQIFAVIGTVLFLGFVLELVRRRRLVERYALLWIVVALFGVVLAVWNDALNSIAHATGIQSPTNGLFLLGLVAIVGMLLNFSAAISRLSEETKILAQTAARLDAEIRQLRGKGPAAPNGNGASPDEGAATAATAAAAETAVQPAESETDDA
jgi:hypothetical protein